jgi:hypothetical protein
VVRIIVGPGVAKRTSDIHLDPRFNY